MSEFDRRTVVDQIASQNRTFYSDPQARALLRIVDLGFEERWTYLLELVQNALDAGARHVRIDTAEDSLVFQHDGTEPLSEAAVKAMSGVFQSTKLASTIGFMGIGFKSVFQRYRSASISGFGWNFKFTIPVTTGRYGDRHADYLGAVTPLWDDEIVGPASGFTTRFEVADLIDAGDSPRKDIEKLIPSEHRAVLAILAHVGLRSLQIDTLVWQLACAGDSPSAVVHAQSQNEHHSWRLFIHEYVPSDAAVRRLLERRRLNRPEHEQETVYANARKTRRIVGILPINKEGIASAPPQGRIYATLPTSATWNFRLHLQADWMVNLSRTGLPALEDNEWQAQLVDEAAEVLLKFLDWVSESSDPVFLKAAFEVLRPPVADTVENLDTAVARSSWKKRVADGIRARRIIPVYIDKQVRLVTAGEASAAPRGFHPFAISPHYRPEQLFGQPLAVETILGQDAIAFLDWLDLWEVLEPNLVEHRWGAGLGNWWTAVEDLGPERTTALFELWNAVGRAAAVDPGWGRLPCVPTVAGGWVSGDDAEYVEEQGPSRNDPLGLSLLEFLEPHYPHTSQRLSDTILSVLRQPEPKDALSPRKAAREWFEAHASEFTVEEVVRAAVTEMLVRDSPAFELFIMLAQWARPRGRSKLLTHVVASTNGRREIVAAVGAVLARPYCEHGETRQRMWPEKPFLVDDFVTTDPSKGTGHEWSNFFEQLELLGPARVRLVEHHLWGFERETVGRMTGLQLSASEAPSSGRQYTVSDREFDPPILEHQVPWLAQWLSNEHSRLRGTGYREVEWIYHRRYSRRGQRPASWVEQLQSLKWVPASDGSLWRPDDVLRESDPSRPDANWAELPSELVATLESEGVRFGSNIPVAPQLRRLQHHGSTMTAEELAQAFRDSMASAATSASDRQLFLETIHSLAIPLLDEGRRTTILRLVEHAGSAFRSSLGDWITPLDLLAEPIRDAIESDPSLVFVPPTTTGTQALAFLLDIWDRAARGELEKVQEVREYLPLAYTYLIEDMEEDDLLALEVERVLSRVRLFGRKPNGKKGWGPITGEPRLVYDDSGDQLLRRFLGESYMIVTAGHLGSDRSVQDAVARTLTLPFVSDLLAPVWQRGFERPAGEWAPRFEALCGLIALAAAQETESEPRTVPQLHALSSLTLSVRGQVHPIYAKLEGNGIYLSGVPADFAVEATSALSDYYSLGDDATIIAPITLMLSFLDDEARFWAAAARFVEAYPETGEVLSQRPLVTGLDPEDGDLPSPDLVRVSEPANTIESVPEAELIEQRKVDLEAAGDRLVESIQLGGTGYVPGTFTGPTSVRPYYHPITTEQERRGKRGEEEFLRRVSSEGGWSSMTLIADRRRDGCGYDFLCHREGKEIKVEVKTFAPEGRVIITPTELNEARASGEDYHLIGILDDGQDPSQWKASLRVDPSRTLLERATWQVSANLTIPASDVFPTPV
ncbi:MAG: DUF3883 domain-containing protein [Gemmatimonadaceae bacterium]